MKALFALLVFATITQAGSWTIGNSGAPGTGRCASSCHGDGIGTIVVTGFPETYFPDSLYLIQLSDAGGVSIKNFNASCRLGESVNPAGVLIGTGTTTTYSVPEEINGVTMNTLDLNTAEFYWLAPSAGSGQTRLYVGAHQGGYTGANTDIVLIAEEALASSGRPPYLAEEITLSVCPNPFNSSATISFELNAPQMTNVIVYDTQGRLVETLFNGIAASGQTTMTWSPRGASGVYWIDVTSAGRRLTQKALFAK